MTPTNNKFTNCSLNLNVNSFMTYEFFCKINKTLRISPLNTLSMKLMMWENLFF